MNIKRFMWIGIFAVLLTVVIISLFACNNSGEDEESGGGGFSGIIAPTNNKDVLVRVGNNTVTMKELAQDQRFKSLMADKIFAAILLDVGQKDRIEITDEMLDKQIDRIKKQFPDEAMFEKQMKDMGYTIETLREDQRKFLILDRLLRDKMQISEEDLRDYYDQEKRMIDQTYAAENGLTEEETLNLTFETVRDTADQLYVQYKGNEVFPGLREELIREYFPMMKFIGVPEMTLADFQIVDETAAPPETSGSSTGGQTGEAPAPEGATSESAGTETDSGSSTETPSEGEKVEGEGDGAATPPAEGEAKGE